MPKRRDINHKEIRDALRNVYRVYDTADLGDGFPDMLVVSRANVAVLLEIKSPGGKLTDDEKKFHECYTAPLHIVYSAEEAFVVMQDYDGG